MRLVRVSFPLSRTDLFEVRQCVQQRAPRHGNAGIPGVWKTLAILGLAFGLGGISWGYAQQRTVPAQASDPWVGTWRLNVARSTFSPGPPPKVQILDIQSREGDGLHVVTNGTDAAGRPTHTERTARFDGRDYPAQGFEQPTTQAFTRVDARSYSIVSKAGGRIITRTRVTVSPDGKTMTTVTTGDVGQGPINNTQVLEKQTP